MMRSIARCALNWAQILEPKAKVMAKCKIQTKTSSSTSRWFYRLRTRQ
jgi:hypothetical protein